LGGTAATRPTSRKSRPSTESGSSRYHLSPSWCTVIPPLSVTARLVITCRYGFGPVARAGAPPWAAGVAPDAPVAAAGDGLPAGVARDGPPLVRGAGDGAGLGAQDATVTAAAVSQTMLRTM